MAGLENIPPESNRRSKNRPSMPVESLEMRYLFSAISPTLALWASGADDSATRRLVGLTPMRSHPLPAIAAPLRPGASRTATSAAATRPGGRAQYLATVSVAPAALSLAAHTSYRFSAVGFDTFARPMANAPAFSWSVLPGGVGGTITVDGLYTAPATTGQDILQVSAAGITRTLAVTVTPSGIFSRNVDVGSPVVAGHYFVSGSTYTVTGSGSDIWNTSDQFNFASTALTGDGMIVARVVGLQNTNNWAKAGIMFRDTSAAGSRDAYVTMTPHGQVQFLNRSVTGGTAADGGDATGIPLPMWVKLVRQGNNFTGFWSTDGKAWNQLGSAVTIAMGATVSVGLVTSSANTAVPNAATYDNVTVTQQPASAVYRLTTRGQAGMALDVEGWGNVNGTPVSLYTANHTSNQQWLVQSQGDGTYKIYAYSGQNSLQTLDDNGGNTANGTPVTTWDDNNTSAQRWIFVPDGTGYWRIVPANGAGTNQTLEIVGGNSAGLQARTDIYSYYGGNNQVFHLDDPGAPVILPSYKKGLAGNPNEISNIHPSWFYTWGGDEPAGTPANVEFVPMAWGYYGNANNSFSNWLNNYVKKQPGVKNLLGFNEPDSSSQANLSVASALDGWQYMVGSGLPLGSPAGVHADDQWMRDFMSGAASKGYRVDYVTIHWYGGNDPQGFINYVDYIHNLYNKPVWITEFAPADWSGNHGISPQQAYDFMRQVIPALNSRSYVERYSWFSADVSDAALGQAALFNHDGSLTTLGQLYARV
jgi:hypothetical protein